MDIWQIVVIVVLAALILVWVAVIAYNKGLSLIHISEPTRH